MFTYFTYMNYVDKFKTVLVATYMNYVDKFKTVLVANTWTFHINIIDVVCFRSSHKYIPLTEYMKLNN